MQNLKKNKNDFFKERVVYCGRIWYESWLLLPACWFILTGKQRKNGLTGISLLSVNCHRDAEYCILQYLSLGQHVQSDGRIQLGAEIYTHSIKEPSYLLRANKNNSHLTKFFNKDYSHLRLQNNLL
jgi:hypothetical protein